MRELVGEGFRFLATVATMAAFHAAATAQIGFNVDINMDFAPPEGGGGVPSSSFAAAGKAGFWNSVSGLGRPPQFLFDLNGNLTSVLLTGPLGGSGGGWNVPGLNADYRALMADTTGVNPSRTYTLSGLASGLYHVYSYAVRPSGGMASTSVTVLQSVGQATRIATGPFQVNTFTEGVTHTIHTANVTSGELTIHLEMGQQPSHFNGFQIVAVPEPGSLAVLGAGLGLLLRKRKK